MGTQLPSSKGGAVPPAQFLAHVYCGQTVGWNKMPLGMEVGLGPGHTALDGDPAPPHFSAHVYCGQTVGWNKMPLGMEVGLGPGHTVLDEDPAYHFSAHVYCGQTAGWIKMPVGTKVGLSSGHIVLDGKPAAPSQKGGTVPQFSADVLLWPNGPLLECRVVTLPRRETR